MSEAKPTKDRTLSIILAIVLGIGGVFLGGLGSIWIAQAMMGRLGKPIDEESAVSMIGMPIGLVLFAWLGWKLGAAIRAKSGA